MCRDLPIRPYEADRGGAAAQSRFVEGRRKTGSSVAWGAGQASFGISARLALKAIGNAVAVGIPVVLVGDAVVIVVAVRSAARRVVVGVAAVVGGSRGNVAVVTGIGAVDWRRGAVAIVTSIIIAVVVAAVIGGVRIAAVRIRAGGSRRGDQAGREQPFLCCASRPPLERLSMQRDTRPRVALLLRKFHFLCSATGSWHARSLRLV